MKLTAFLILCLRAVAAATPLHILSLVVAAVLTVLANSAYAQSPDTVCIKCHSGLPGRLGAPPRDWRGSIHAQNGISCHNCHGGDPTDMAMAMSPERGFLGKPKAVAVPDFCGRCHVGVKEDYLASAHGRALGRGGPTCVTCHSNHAVRTATPDLINPRDCSRGHDDGRAGLIKQAMVSTDKDIGALFQTLTTLHRTGIVTKEMEDELFSLRNRFHRLFHSVDLQKVSSQNAEFQTELAKIHGRVAAIEDELDRRKLWGGAAVGILVCLGIVALFIFKSYREEK